MLRFLFLHCWAVWIDNFDQPGLIPGSWMIKFIVVTPYKQPAAVIVRMGIRQYYAISPYDYG